MYVHVFIVQLATGRNGERKRARPISKKKQVLSYRTERVICITELYVFLLAYYNDKIYAGCLVPCAFIHSLRIKILFRRKSYIPTTNYKEKMYPT